MYKKYFSHFLNANPNSLHFACHSHHYWPDVTKHAQNQYWEDTAKLVDEKWNHIFSNVIPEAQKNIASILSLSHPEQITFAPNTHELVYRVLSSFSPQKKISILTTDSEFYSFERQARRMEERNNFTVKRIPLEPLETFKDRFLAEAKEHNYDITFFSHVFFNNGFAISNLVQFSKDLRNTGSLVFIDGYHGYMALPTDLSQLEGEIYYTSGSYKYAAAGEGACFLVSPKSNELRPEFTGWFAEMGELANKSEGVPYSQDGLKFAGATIDFTPIYRLNATLNLFKTEGISTKIIHQHVHNNQCLFLKLLEGNELLKKLKTNTTLKYGHFLAFNFADNTQCSTYCDKLKELGIQTDYRRNTLRFGFSIYQNESDIKEAVEKIKSLT